MKYVIIENNMYNSYFLTKLFKNLRFRKMKNVYQVPYIAPLSPIFYGETFKYLFNSFVITLISLRRKYKQDEILKYRERLIYTRFVQRILKAKNTSPGANLKHSIIYSEWPSPPSTDTSTMTTPLFVVSPREGLIKYFKSPSISFSIYGDNYFPKTWYSMEDKTQLDHTEKISIDPLNKRAELPSIKIDYSRIENNLSLSRIYAPFTPYIGYQNLLTTYKASNKNVLFRNIYTPKLYSPYYTISKITYRSYMDTHDGWDIPSDNNATFDINDPNLAKNSDCFTSLYLHDLNLNSYKRYRNLSEKDKKKIKNYVYGLKNWYYIDDKDMEINPNEEGIPTYNKVIGYIKSILESLEDNTIYKCMVIGIGTFGIKTSASSIFISKKTNPDFLAQQFISYCTGIQMKYLSEDFTCFKLTLRKWLTKEEINTNFDSLLNQIELQNRKLVNFMKTQKRHFLPPRFSETGEIINNTTNWLSDSTKNMCGFIVYDNITIGSYGKSLSNGWYKHDNYDINVKVVATDYHVTLYKASLLKAKWIDRYCDPKINSWVRHFNHLGIRVLYEGSTYKHAEMRYKTSHWQPTTEDKEYNKKIGSLDIETFTDNDGIGLAIPYAGFRKITGEEELFYLNAQEDPINMLCRMITRLLDEKNDGWLFYVHNLSRFDSRFILAALGRMGLKPKKLLGRAINEIFFITISKKIGKKNITVTLTDSMYILSSSLDNLAKKFATENKGYFPYSFVRADNLYYEGQMPPYNHYNKLDKAEYDKKAYEYILKIILDVWKKKPYNIYRKILFA